MSTSAVKIVRDRDNGRLRPGFRWEQADDFWPLAQHSRFDTAQGLGARPLRRRPRGLGANGLGFTGTEVPQKALPASACSLQPRGACHPSGQGAAWFGFHCNVTGTTTASQTNTKPDLDVRGNLIVAGGTELWNWLITELKVNADNAILHGDACPASIFAPWSRHPVPFDLILGRGQDKLTCSSRNLVTTSLDKKLLMMGLQTCFESECWPARYPCDSPITKQGTRQIIVGMGNGSQVQDLTENNGTGTLVGKSSQDTLLGNLILEAVMSNTPEDLPVPGMTAADGCRGLGFVEVTEFNIQSVLVFSTDPDTASSTSAIPAEAFGSDSAGMFFPDIVVNSSEALNVKLKNRAPAAGSTAYDNDVRVAGAFVGCMLV